MLLFLRFFSIQASLDLRVDQDHKVNQVCVEMPEKEGLVDLLVKMAALVSDIFVAF